MTTEIPSHEPARRPTVLFRADGSGHVGFGHLVRCSTLAREFKDAGLRVLLATRRPGGFPQWVTDLFPGEIHELEGPGDPVLEQAGPSSHADWLGTSQGEDADQLLELLDRLDMERVEYLIVDHYGIDETWHRRVRPFCRKLVAIDDLADRGMDVDVLLDQNRSPEQAAVDYGERLPSKAVLLAGPHWSLIRREFRDHRGEPRTTNPEVPRVLVIMGGSDPDELTSDVIQSLTGIDPPLDVTVVIGQPDQLERLESMRESTGHSLHIRVAETQMASLMARADFAISAAGSTVWELCCIGVPMVLLATEANQQAVVQQAQTVGAAVRLPEVQPGAVSAIIGAMLKEGGRMEAMSHAGRELVDGGGARRVSEVILSP